MAKVKGTVVDDHGSGTSPRIVARRRRRKRRRRRRSLLRIVHARGAIPNEMGPTRCRATQALTNQPTRPAPRPPGACREKDFKRNHAGVRQFRREEEERRLFNLKMYQ